MPGATSFEHLQTVDGHPLSTFKEACMARQLLLDDAEWNNALREASTLQMPPQIRQLFVAIIVHCNPSDATGRWNNHWEAMSKDFA